MSEPDPVLVEQRDQLLRSIQDLDREHDVGDLPDGDYLLLRDAYTARAASVLKAIEGSTATHKEPEVDGSDPSETGDRSDVETTSQVAQSEVPSDPRPSDPRRSDPDRGDSRPGDSRRSKPRSSNPRWRRRRAFLIAGLAVVVVLIAVVILTSSTSSRLPGQTATGSIRLSPQQQVQRSLSQAATLEAQGNDAQALQLYQQVLAQDPGQSQALAEAGWLEFEAGVEAKDSKLLSQGQLEELKAERASPGSFAPHLYLGSMFLVENDSADAVVQYRSFLADHPPSAVLDSAAPFIERAFADAHLAAPPLPSTTSQP